MHQINKKNGNLKLMAIKVDMARAYHRVDWDFLAYVLHCHGFFDQFVSLILECISSPSYSLLLNGSLFGINPNNHYHV